MARSLAQTDRNVTRPASDMQSDKLSKSQSNKRVTVLGGFALSIAFFIWGHVASFGQGTPEQLFAVSAPETN